MKMNFLKLMFTAALAIAVIFTTSCGNSQTDEATDATQTELTDDAASDEPVVEDAESHESHESHEGHEHDAVAEASFQCPMKCEAEKTYHEKGNCPKCGMPLEKL